MELSQDPLLSAGAGVPTGPCPDCEREVVGYVAGTGDDGGIVYACVHCDRPLRHVDLTDEAVLGEMGYDSWDPGAVPGCGTGCAAGGCGVKRPPRG